MDISNKINTYRAKSMWLSTNVYFESAEVYPIMYESLEKKYEGLANIK